MAEAGIVRCSRVVYCGTVVVPVGRYDKAEAVCVLLLQLIVGVGCACGGGEQRPGGGCEMRSFNCRRLRVSLKLMIFSFRRVEAVRGRLFSKTETVLLCSKWRAPTPPRILYRRDLASISSEHFVFSHILRL